MVSASRGEAVTSFAREIIPLLTQSGCNGLNCHGSPAGKAGFKLSMYGFDAAADYAALVKQPRSAPEKGTRVEAGTPERSLALLKATLRVPHQGGMRFKADSPEARLLEGWIKAGCPTETDELAPTVAELTLFPTERVFARTGERQRLVVMARYTDGSEEDVTRRSLFVSNDDTVAREEDGEVVTSGLGETSVFARYLGRVGVAQVLAPPPVRPPASGYAGFQPANFIDTLSLAKWRRMGYAPSDPATDAEFLRRVSLDLTGTLPRPDEVRSFLSDTVPDKRSRKIDELLGRPEYADWWTLFWGDLLRNNSRLVQPDGARAYRDWVRLRVAENRPYDQFVRELVTATGRNFENGAVNYFRVTRTAPEVAEQTAQLFLGIRLQCAQCHNHPFEKWTRTAYHQFAAIFARTTTRGIARNEVEIVVNPRGEYRNPENNQVLSPAVLDDAQPEMPTEKDRREVLAEWLVRGENKLFARNLVNRLWGQLFGRGLINPVDDVRVTNPAVNEALLSRLAEEFVRGGFDVKQILRTIANSRTYQLSVRANRWNSGDTVNFSRSYHRRLKAEALLDAICQATNVPENFGNGNPPGTRAIQLIDNRQPSYFMDIFGRPRREVVCTCEREETGNLTQALHLINGTTLQNKLTSPAGRIADWIRSGRTDGAIIEELYLWTISRPPTAEELRRGSDLLAAAGPPEATGAAQTARKNTLEDLAWVLLNSREFLFNH